MRRSLVTPTIHTAVAWPQNSAATRQQTQTRVSDLFWMHKCTLLFPLIDFCYKSLCNKFAILFLESQEYPVCMYVAKGRWWRPLVFFSSSTEQYRQPRVQWKTARWRRRRRWFQRSPPGAAQTFARLLAWPARNLPEVHSRRQHAQTDDSALSGLKGMMS